MNKNSKLWTVLKGIIAENPVLVLVLGTCPALGASMKIVDALILGIAATLILICSNTVISLLRKIIPDTVRIPCYIVVIASFVTIVMMVCESILPVDVYGVIKGWLALTVVNCIILGRAEMFARKNKVVDSALDGLGMGLGFLFALLLMAVIREIFGNASIDLSALQKMGILSIEKINIGFLAEYKLPILQQTSGGFFVYGILIAIVNALGPKKGAEKRKNFSGEGCPSASICGRVSCSENAELVSASENNTLVEKTEKEEA